MYKASAVVYAYNPITHKMEVKGHPKLHTKFEASLPYIRHPLSKIKINKKPKTLYQRNVLTHVRSARNKFEWKSGVLEMWGT